MSLDRCWWFLTAPDWCATARNWNHSKALHPRNRTGTIQAFRHHPRRNSRLSRLDVAGAAVKNHANQDSPRVRSNYSAAIASTLGLAEKRRGVAGRFGFHAGLLKKAQIA